MEHWEDGTVDPLAEFVTPEFRRNPYPFYRWLREHDPVHRTSAGFYLISRHADASFVLRETGGKFLAPERSELAETSSQGIQARTRWLLAHGITALNPPAHTRLRRLVARDFTPRMVNRLIGRITVSCDKVLDDVDTPLRDGAEVDLHRRWSVPFTAEVISELIGVPEADRAWLKAEAGDITASIAAVSTGGRPDLEEVGDRACARLLDYLRHLARERRRAPRDDLVSALVSERNEDKLDENELLTQLWLLWVAGFENTAIAIDTAVLTLVAHPDQAGWLRGGHEQAAAFAAEALRFTGLAVFAPIPRLLTCDLELAGTRLAAGSDVRPMFGAADRDPEVFPDPDRFDPSRDNGRSLSLGLGIHQCLGAVLARTQMAVGLARLHARFPTLVNTTEPVWGCMLTQPKDRTLPVALTKY